MAVAPRLHRSGAGQSLMQHCDYGGELTGRQTHTEVWASPFWRGRILPKSRQLKGATGCKTSCVTDVIRTDSIRPGKLEFPDDFV